MENNIAKLPERDLRATPFGYASNKFKIKEEVWLQSEYDLSWKERSLDPSACLPPTHRIIGIRLVEPEVDGELVDHPYWMYELDINGGQANWIEEHELLYPVDEDDGSWI